MKHMRYFESYVARDNASINMISFWRVIFTYLIAAHHLYNRYSIVTCWMIGVEFFFIVSGWLLAEKADTISDYSTFDYIIYRIKRIYPLYIISLCLCVLCMRYSMGWNVTNEWSINSIRRWFAEYGFKEVLMIHYWPWGTKYWTIANIPTWYISVMLLSGLILFSLYKSNKIVLCQVIIPVCVVIFYTSSYKMYHNFTEDEIINDFISLKVLRGFTEMGLGIFLHELHKQFGNRKSIVTNMIGFLCLAIVVIMSFSKGEQYNYIYVVLISVGIFYSFDAEVKYGRKIIGFLSHLSYSIYLNHNVIRLYVMPVFFSKVDFYSMTVYLVIVTCFAWLLQFLTFFIYNTKYRIKEKIMNTL